ncbi:hypothetical protein, partial [Thalassospira sp.]
MLKNKHIRRNSIANAIKRDFQAPSSLLAMQHLFDAAHRYPMAARTTGTAMPVAGETNLYRGASILVAGRKMESDTAATLCHASGAG